MVNSYTNISKNEQSPLTLTHWSWKRGDTTYDVENQGPGFEQAQNCGGVKSVKH